MEEEIDFYIDEAKESMDKTIKRTITELAKVRAGKAMPSMLDGIKVDYYGSQSPISQVASINTPDARTIIVKPWEKTILQEIERAIINSDLGLNPQNDGEIIRLSIPALTEERRREYVKHAKSITEDGKVAVRNSRKEANDSLKKLQKDGASEDMVKTAESKVQDLTNSYTKELDTLFEEKEKDIMTV